MGHGQRSDLPLGRPIVIARSPRYHGNFGFWESILPLIQDRCVYVGHPKEHEYFVYTFGHQVMHLPTPDIVTLARIIAGCRQFIGNVGFPHALAEAMKKELINEVYRVHPTTVFQRPGRNMYKTGELGIANCKMKIAN